MFVFCWRSQDLRPKQLIDNTFPLRILEYTMRILNDVISEIDYVIKREKIKICVQKA